MYTLKVFLFYKTVGIEVVAAPFHDVPEDVAEGSFDLVDQFALTAASSLVGLSFNCTPQIVIHQIQIRRI